MIAYKLFRKLKDGSLAPLFINKRQRISKGIWLDSECHPTKGFAVRQGWHCTTKPEAPHLSSKDRVWCQVEVEEYEEFKRPASQGGLWLLAQRMKLIGQLEETC
jgi:hypothetical protein